MTDLEILDYCVKQLGIIDVPVGLLEKIGIPIYNVRSKLIALQNAVANNSQKESEVSYTEEPVSEETVEESNN